MSRATGLEYEGLAGLRGPLAFVSGVSGVSYHEHVELRGPDGRGRAGRVIAVSSDHAVLEVFAGTDGLPLERTRAAFQGHPLRFGVGEEMLGRVFDGLGRPRDGLPQPLAVEQRPIEGAPVNPCRREYPRDLLETGISAIDGLNTLVLGQKLPLFSESGLSHDALAMQIVRQAQAPGGAPFAVIFVALGLPRDVAMRYEADFRKSGALSRTVAFLNLADDPAAERLIAPRCALTAAEFLAFDRGWHVLVVANDITNYGEALREVASAAGEVPSRKGYPGYLYSDLASLFERAGRIRGRPGSVTQLPILTMPAGDVTHPIPDLTGYITEGQIVLDRGLERRGIYPPVDVLPSLSRLMGDGIGAGRTREDHEAVARQTYAACARSARARALESIIGRDELSEVERAYLAFGDVFEERFLPQRPDERRPVAETLERAWEALMVLPEGELGRLPAEQLSRRLASRPHPPEVAA
ncbi:MAG TPA: V-type ATP synthase subunit B [Thermoanaerobaculia bacterium]|nr:V-type ATP synthase subunit B [Thermoanaerobaculia bacterium]